VRRDHIQPGTYRSYPSTLVLACICNDVIVLLGSSDPQISEFRLETGFEDH